MRVIPPALQAKLDSGVTTLCRCWIIERSDGIIQGFTDHDEDVALGSVACRAGSGLSGSDALSGDISQWAITVVTAYFGGRTLEKVARLFAKK